jgi:hypothetical protein
MGRRDTALEASYPEVRLIWVEDIGLPSFAAHSVRFDIIEFSTNVKPYCLMMLLEHHKQVLYLDPDTCVFDTLTPVYDELNSWNVVVTPATTTPILDGHRPDDIEFLRVGVFNLGFIGVASTEEGLRFLRWWSDRCLAYGFHETQTGVFVDQKWVNLAPCLFSGVKILKDPGINMAHWNLHERTLSVVDGCYWVNGTVPLRLFHFSSFDPSQPHRIANRQTRFAPGNRKDLNEILAKYAEALYSENYEEFSKIDYSFDYFPSGEYISPTLRRIYANPSYAFDITEDPTSSDSALMKLSRAHGLLGSRVTKAKRLTAHDIGQYSSYIKIIGFILKILLKLLGANRYFLLMRYLGHVSSIRNQPPL